MGTRLEHTATRIRHIRLGRVGTDWSWLSLLAETTRGLGAVVCYRVHVQSDALAGDGSHRLIAQSYSKRDVSPDLLPIRGARPLGSAQRAVDSEALRTGVDLSLMHMMADRGTVIVAWVEPGNPDLEFDGQRTRPNPTHLFGGATARRSRRARIVLRAPTHPDSPSRRAARHDRQGAGDNRSGNTSCQ